MKLYSVFQFGKRYDLLLFQFTELYERKYLIYQYLLYTSTGSLNVETILSAPPISDSLSTDAVTLESTTTKINSIQNSVAESLEAQNELDADFRVDDAISDIASIIPPTGTYTQGYKILVNHTNLNHVLDLRSTKSICQCSCKFLANHFPYNSLIFIHINKL